MISRTATANVVNYLPNAKLLAPIAHSVTLFCAVFSFHKKQALRESLKSSLNLAGRRRRVQVSMLMLYSCVAQKYEYEALCVCAANWHIIFSAVAVSVSIIDTSKWFRH